MTKTTLTRKNIQLGGLFTVSEAQLTITMVGSMVAGMVLEGAECSILIPKQGESQRHWAWHELLKPQTPPLRTLPPMMLYLLILQILPKGSLL